MLSLGHSQLRMPGRTEDRACADTSTRHARQVLRCPVAAACSRGFVADSHGQDALFWGGLQSRERVKAAWAVPEWPPCWRLPGEHRDDQGQNGGSRSSSSSIGPKQVGQT